MSDQPDVPPVSADRPFVDATDRSVKDLRAELDQLNEAGPADAEAHVREARQDLGATVSELSDRLDVPARARHRVAEVRTTASDTARAHAGLIGAGVGAAVLAVVLLRLRASAAARRA